MNETIHVWANGMGAEFLHDKAEITIIKLLQATALEQKAPGDTPITQKGAQNTGLRSLAANMQ